MNNPERQNNQPEIIPSQGTPLTWRALGLRILAGYVIFGVVNQIFVPVEGQWWSSAKRLVGTILTHSLQFSFVFGITAVVALLIARVPPKNRNKPLTSFLNVALIAAILLSGILIYGGWVARNNPLLQP
jgi:hypothetical protein